MKPGFRHFRMPFGKHYDKPLCEIPLGYLEWLANNVVMQGDLKRHVTAEIAFRNATSGQVVVPPREIDVAAWYRRLSIEFHPDRGGSCEAMVAINRGKELLQEMLTNGSHE